MCMLTSVCYLEDYICAIHEKQHAIFLDAIEFYSLVCHG
uniref:Uncharacterized protein n=1 Tax=Wuchereria bancrofti TaxID=6293 RepID=A0AAF5PGH0_WUCBA